MRRIDIPANISLMQLSEERLKALKPVTVLDMFDGTNIHFHEDGLFSTSIFGRVGSDERDTRFSFIRLNTTVLHPIVFETLIKLKGLYLGIMSGKAYAVWDDKEKDFISADQLVGQTGYSFFMSHWKKIKHKDTGSDIRELRKKLVDKNLELAETKYVLVIPAGLRDVQIDEGGRVKEGEINTFYRTMIAVSNGIGTNEKTDTPIYDNSRFALQNAFNKLYEQLYTYIEGKGGFIQRKWGARRVFNGTRNVITAMDTTSSVLGAPNSPKHNQTVMGLYQLSKNLLPYTKFKLLSGWLAKVFNTTEGNALLINTKSLKQEYVKVDADIIDRWTSSAGMEKLLNYIGEPDNRLKPIVINGYYVGLVYRPKDKLVFKVFSDIDQLPTGDVVLEINDTDEGMDKQLFITTLKVVLKQFEIDENEYMISSGGALLMRGLRNKSRDIDISVSENVWNKLKDKMEVTSYGDNHPLVIHVKVNEYDVELYADFPKVNAEHDLIDGVRVLSLQGLLKEKELREPKKERDLNDIKNIKAKMNSSGSGFNREDVHPLTYCELVYLCAYQEWNTKPTFITRYPVTGIGSIYPSYPYLKTTVIGEVRVELDDNWQPKGEEFTALEYPTFNEPMFVDTLTPHPSRLAGLNGDFDGDTSSANTAYMDDSIQEVKDFFTKRKSYVNAEGKFHASTIVETVERVLLVMTGEVK